MRRRAAIVIMAFDEQGQADTLARRIAICQRAYDIRRTVSALPPKISSSTRNAFESQRASKSMMATVSTLSRRRAGSVSTYRTPTFRVASNLSFSFRGNEPVREAMHSVFLYHAIKVGMDMGIVNAAQMAVYDDLDPELRETCEDVVLNRRKDGTVHRLRSPSVSGGRLARTKRNPIYVVVVCGL